MSLTTIKWAAIGIAFFLACAFSWRQGALNVQSKWDKEKAEMNAQAAKEIEEANNRVRAIEQAANARVAKTEQLFNQRLKEKSREEDDAINRARAGGLYINAKCPNHQDAVPGVAEGAGASDAEARVELPQEDGEFLIRLAAEADRVTEQLSACQRILEDQRK